MAIQNTKEIDLISHSPETGVVRLVMIEDRPWDGNGERLFELQEKLNNYLAFACDGEFEKKYPEYKDSPLIIELMAVQQPDEGAAHFLEHAREYINKERIEFAFTLLDPGEL